MFRRRMVVHLPECAGEIKLVREPELIADLLDGQIRGVEQLHGVLHAQMVQVSPLARRCVLWLSDNIPPPWEANCAAADVAGRAQGWGAAPPRSPVP